MIAYEPFKSALGDRLQSYVQLKRDCGFIYKESSRILHHFDEMILESFPDADTLTREICIRWVDSLSSLALSGQAHCVSVVRMFGKYLNGIGVPAYVIPEYIPGKVPKYEAHIFTDEEIRAFFRAVDRVSYCLWSPTRCYVIPVFFRLLYSCGLRSSEARLLAREDVDLNTGKIIVRESKFRKRRVLFMSPDMLSVSAEYDAIIQRLMPNRKPFFPNRTGNHYGKSRTDDWFHIFWDPLPEAKAVRGNPPRLHDFRHTFAVRRINEWVRENRDIQSLYAYLSEYMGHESYHETDYYISLSEMFYPEMRRRMEETNKAILPEALK